MPGELDEVRAGRLESVAPRARRLLGRQSAAGAGLGSTSHESMTSTAGPPGEHDRADMARQIRRAAGRPSSAGLQGRDASVEADGIAGELLARAERVMADLERGASNASLSASDAVALEAVLHVRGRPAVRVEGTTLEDMSVYPGAELWRMLAELHETNLLAVAGATAAVHVRDRIAPQFAWVQGTAWLVAPDRAVTNRHVLFPSLGGTRLARRVPGSPAARLKTDLEVTLDFAFDNGPSRAVRYAVSNVPFVSADDDPVDVAVLTVTPLMPPGVPAPTPLIVSRAALFDADPLYVLGHPGRMPAVPEKVLAVFGNPDERKRVSFGQFLTDAPSAPGEVVHDASTIGGYSGGCVLGFLSRDVRALHYYGDPLAGNRAITAATLRGHAVGAFL